MFITNFAPDPTRLAPLRDCIDNYEIGALDAEWPNNIISRKTVVYGSGVVARAGVPVKHNVAPEELALCKRLSAEAWALMSNVKVGMGSESDDPFFEFFIAANVDDPIPPDINETLLRSKFGGTIFPLATISVEPLKEEGDWWSAVLDDVSESSPQKQESHLARWRELIKWFSEQTDLKDAAFVMIGDYGLLNSWI